MTTAELVNMDREAFGDAIARLDAAGCARHGRDLFHRLGPAAPYEEYVKDMTRTAVCFYDSPEEQFTELYEVSRRYFPGVPAGYDVFGKLIALTVKIVSESLPAAGRSDAKKGPGKRGPGRRR